MSDKLMTNVTGYYNPNTWSVHVSISECNLGITLKPNEFIKDRATGKKINDPLLDRYCGPKMLAQETAPEPVEVLRLPVVTAIRTAGAGYVVGQGHKDSTGKWQPPTQSNPMPNEAPPESRASIRAMSVEEARKAGLIGKPRILPEDYGATDTDGAPTRGDAIPKIKYSMESRPKVQAGELPKELVEGVAPQHKALLAGLEAQASQAAESADLSAKAAESAVQAQLGDEGVREFRQEKKTLKKVAKKVDTKVAKPEPTPPAAAVAEVAAPAQEEQGLPEPDLGESPIVGGLGDEEAETQEPPLPPAAKKKRASKPKKKVRCEDCGQEFDYPAWLKRHVLRHHPERLQAAAPPAAKTAP